MKYDSDFWMAIDKFAESSNIIIDRPKGTAHPRFPDFIYKIDYGYLENTASMDGAGVDVWIGSRGDNKIDAIMCICLLYTSFRGFLPRISDCLHHSRSVRPLTL